MTVWYRIYRLPVTLYHDSWLMGISGKQEKESNPYTCNISHNDSNIATSTEVANTAL